MKFLTDPFFTESSALFDIHTDDDQYFGEVSIHFGRFNIIRITINFHARNKKPDECLSDFRILLSELNYNFLSGICGLLINSANPEIYIRLFYMDTHSAWAPFNYGELNEFFNDLPGEVQLILNREKIDD